MKLRIRLRAWRFARLRRAALERELVVFWADMATQSRTVH